MSIYISQIILPHVCLVIYVPRFQVFRASIGRQGSFVPNWEEGIRTLKSCWWWFGTCVSQDLQGSGTGESFLPAEEMALGGFLTERDLRRSREVIDN